MLSHLVHEAHEEALKNSQLVQGQQSKLQEAEKSGDYFSGLPQDVIFVIFSHSPYSDIEQFALVSQSFNSQVMSYFPDTTYYAASNPIELYTQTHFKAYGEILSCPQKREVNFNKIQKKLPMDQTFLFREYSDAQAYCQLSTSKSYDKSSDVFIVNAIPAVLVVKLTRSDVLKVKSCTLKITERVPICPIPPAAKTGTFFAFRTPRDNVTAQFAIFDGTLFCKPLPLNEFADSWNKSFNKESSNVLEKKLSSALLALFNNYHTWPLHWLTHHHHNKVAHVVALLNNNKPISEVFAYLTQLSKERLSEGHFTKMIAFALTALDPYMSAHQLTGIDNFFRNEQIKI